MPIQITILITGKPTPEQVDLIMDGIRYLAAQEDLDVTTCLLDKGEIVHVSRS